MAENLSNRYKVLIIFIRCSAFILPPKIHKLHYFGIFRNNNSRNHVTFCPLTFKNWRLKKELNQNDYFTSCVFVPIIFSRLLYLLTEKWSPTLKYYQRLQSLLQFRVSTKNLELKYPEFFSTFLQFSKVLRRYHIMRG